MFRGAHDGLDRDISKSEASSAFKRGRREPCSTKCSTDLVLRRAQAIDVAIWCALGHSRVAQRTTPICAIVLLRTKAAFCPFYQGGGGCEYRARRCPPFAACAQPNLKSSAAVLYGFRNETPKEHDGAPKPKKEIGRSAIAPPRGSINQLVSLVGSPGGGNPV
jgi:hypothetical protein